MAEILKEELIPEAEEIITLIPYGKKLRKELNI